MIERIPLCPTSIERVIFPAMASDNHLFQLELPGYWMDIGQPKDYLIAQALYIKSETEKKSGIVCEGHQGHGVIIHESAKVAPTA